MGLLNWAEGKKRQLPTAEEQETLKRTRLAEANGRWEELSREATNLSKRLLDSSVQGDERRKLGELQVVRQAELQKASEEIAELGASLQMTQEEAREYRGEKHYT